MLHTDFGTLLSMHAWVETVSNEAADFFVLPRFWCISSNKAYRERGWKEFLEGERGGWAMATQFLAN